MSTHNVLSLGSGSSKAIEEHSKKLIVSRRTCGICMEGKRRLELFINKAKCSHNSFCIECISKHVAAKIEGNSTVITCPEPTCKATLEPEICRGFIAKEVFETWTTALFKSFCSKSNLVNCPFVDCSSDMFVEDNREIKEAECPHCHRLFCAKCEVPWHLDMNCKDFQRKKKNEALRVLELSHDMMFLELAEENKWIRCPNCKIYVQKIEGCLHITCRCEFEFCYGCGTEWSQTHSGCQGCELN